MDKFKDISNEALDAQRAEKLATLQPLLALDFASMSPEQVAQATTLGAEIDEIDAEKAERAEAATKFDALKKRDFSTPAVTDEVEVEAADEGGDEDDEDEDGEEDAADEGVEEGGQGGTETSADNAVEAANKATKAKGSTVRKVAAKTKRPEVPDSGPRLSIVAAAETGFAAGTQLDLATVTEAVITRLKGMPEPQGDGKTEDIKKYAVATIEKPFEADLVVEPRGDSDIVFQRASQENRLPGGSLVASLMQRVEQHQKGELNSLQAANGWCSPSETIYDLTTDETLDGILSLPEVQVKRGGVRYTRGPQFSDFYSNAGFVQTEAQAIAGTTKPCYEVTCPTFTDVRLDAVGVCIKVPILLNAAYPEMTQRFTSGTLIAHEHMKNANVIGRIVTDAGAARVFAGLGSAATDALEALEIAADQRRQTYRLALDHTLEVVVPFWLKGVYRSDLGRRNGRSDAAVSDAEIMAHFAARNLAVSFVYDWQVLDPAVEVYPDDYQVLIYPAGTYVKGVSNVINLSAVYDAASLAVNTYTGMFVEEGLMVARMKFGSDLLTLPICTAGRTGTPNLTCA